MQNAYSIFYHQSVDSKNITCRLSVHPVFLWLFLRGKAKGRKKAFPGNDSQRGNKARSTVWERKAKHKVEWGGYRGLRGCKERFSEEINLHRDIGDRKEPIFKRIGSESSRQQRQWHKSPQELMFSKEGGSHLRVSKRKTFDVRERVQGLWSWQVTQNHFYMCGTSPRILSETFSQPDTWL